MLIDEMNKKGVMVIGDHIVLVCKNEIVGSRILEKIKERGFGVLFIYWNKIVVNGMCDIELLNKSLQDMFFENYVCVRKTFNEDDYLPF